MSVVPSSAVEIDLREQQRLASLELSAPHLDGYEVLELIGEGTYGEVWRARETKSSVIVAIKRFRHQLDAQSCAEVEHLADLNAARGIVSLRMVHLQTEPFCYVMEYMPGGTLAQLIRRDGPRGFQDAWRIFRQLIEALCYVHREGIVHGDIKAANILLDAAGQPRLCDFGQARGRGSQGKMLGTLFYMPPEQARLEGMPDPRWDVYALGAILYEMLTGTKPRFDEDISKLITLPTNSGTEARDRLEQYARHLERIPVVDAHRHVKQVDSSVEMLIDRCLSLNFEERPADANAVSRLIDQCEHTRRSRPLFVFGGLAPAVLILLLGVFLLVSGRWMLARFSSAWQTNIVAANRAIAQAIASSLGDSFNVRIKIVQNESQGVAWPKLLADRHQPRMLEELSRLYDRRRGEIIRWSVVDSQGWMLANYGRFEELDTDGETVGDECEDNTVVGKNFSWRGWFNGKEDREKDLAGPDAASLADFQARPRSAVYVAEPIWREGEHGFVVTPISCPVAAADNESLSGVLLGSFPYSQLIGWVTEFEQSQSGNKRNVVLANERNQVIYHAELIRIADERRDWPERKRRGEVAGEPREFAVPTSYVPQLSRALRGESDLGRYEDPLDRQHYLGSGALALLDNGQKLAVIVQQEVRTAMGPIQTLRSIVYGLAGGLLAVGVIFLASNMYALYWFLRNQRESAAYV